MITMARVQHGMYFDSITLMQVTGFLHEMAEVDKAAVLLATPANLQLLADMELYPFTDTPNALSESDVLIVVRASDEEHARAALDAAEARLLRDTRKTARGSEELYRTRPPRSLEEARQQSPQARVAAISVPGQYAALEAQQALRAGLHVFLFSDNVSLAEEVELKRMASARGLLMMGADCGTARLHGMGLGFANVVPDGPIGIVGASGTGMQQVMCLLAQAGYGISQAIGCGGRDLAAEVGALTTQQGLRLLQEDAQTRVIVLISKPPDPTVAARVLEVAASGNKPVVVIFVGAEPAAWQGTYGEHIHFASTLSEAVRMASALCATGRVDMPTQTTEAQSSARSGQAPPYIAALFSGGTLCDEALHIWGERYGPVYSNIPLNPAWRWHTNLVGHYALDLGSDEYTRGRPHPMIDPEVRLSHLRAAANNPQVGVILLDIILGYCTHLDPAALYAPPIQQALQQAKQAGRRLECVISLCGTENDPQVLSRQVARFREAGAHVYTSNAEAARRCVELLDC